MIQIAIIEDLTQVAEILKTHINETEDLQCLYSYTNAEDAILFIPKNNVDIVIVDIGLPRVNGIDAIKEISMLCPNIQFCMFTVYEDDEKIFQSLKAGAKGYILKNASKDKIIEAIRDLAQGGSPMSPTIARRIIDVFSLSEVYVTKEALPITERERQLLQLLAKGYLYKEIAHNLGITIGTVKQTIHKIYEKLHVSNKTEAINKLK